MSDTPKVYIVDDEDANLRLAGSYLNGLGYDIKTWSSGVAFMESGPLSAPGCILLDNAMPGLSGIEVQGEVIVRNPCLPVIFISGDSSFEDVFTATRKGAMAFLQKPVTREKLQALVAEAITLSRTLSSKMGESEKARELYATLTDREKEVFQMLVDGKVNKMIARTLDVSLRTVEYHRSHIHRKLGTFFVADLIAIARAAGTLKEPE